MILWLLACTAPSAKHTGESAPATETATETATDTSPETATDSSTETAAETGRDSGDSAADTGDTDAATPVLQFTGPRPHNLLIISLDATRRDQIGYFTGLDTTPNLDRVMAQSVVLEDHRSCSNWTAPSVLCVLTGAMPSDAGWWPTAIDESGKAPEVPWVPDDLHTFTEDLADAGYNTLLVTSNEVFSDRFGGGMTNGFAEVRLPLWFPAPDVEPKATLAASEMLADGRPWYLHVHFIDPHAPYKAPAEWATDLDELGPFDWDVSDEHASDAIEAAWSTMTPEEQAHARDFLLTVYRAEMRYWDDTFATLWAELDTMGALDDTLVVFFTDHGEQFGEHGAFHHGVSLFDQENASTAFFWAKDLAPATWSGRTTHQDLAPTILDALGFPADPAMTGVRVGDAPDDRDLLFFNYIDGWATPQNSVVTGDDKLIYAWSSEKHFEDLATDPTESVNLYSPTDPRVLAAWDLLLPEVERMEATWPGLEAVAPGP